MSQQCYNQCVQTIDIQELFEQEMLRFESPPHKPQLILFNAAFDKKSEHRLPYKKLHIKKHSQPNDITEKIPTDQHFPLSNRAVEFSPFKCELLKQQKSPEFRQIQFSSKQKQQILHHKQRQIRSIVMQTQDKSSLLNILKNEKVQNLIKPNLPISAQFQNKVVKSLMEQKKEEIRKKWDLKQKNYIILTSNPKRVRRVSLQEFLPLTERKFSVKGSQIHTRDNSPARK